MLRDQICTALGAGFGSFSQVLSDWASVQPNALALCDDGGDITRAQMDDAINRLAARLVATGLERRQSDAIWGASNIAYALVFLTRKSVT